MSVFLCVCSLIDYKLRHNIVNVFWRNRSPAARGSTAAWTEDRRIKKTDVNILKLTSLSVYAVLKSTIKFDNELSGQVIY